VIDAFEPDPEIFRVLERNTKRNKWRSVTIHNCAVTNEEGLYEFNRNLQKTLAGSLTSRRINKEKTTPIKVKCKKLSEFINGSIDFMKIDVEGVEELVLTDINSQLTNIDRIFCEYHHGNGLSTDRFFQIIQCLEENDFEYRVAPSSVHKLESRPMDQVGRPYSTSIWACRRAILPASLR
jgi:FkbM family methyltransferase